ncbi:MAG: triphosphoribosyl-dephospho-CoA synthase [Gammaproteobacteria bacterium]|nr:triphosphoribosyl-dephospho-CoA synthase [Gammaproteobacteria bacterium]
MRSARNLSGDAVSAISREPFRLARREAAAAFRMACRYDVLADKPGNVSFEAAGHGMSAAEFLLSAKVAADPATDIEQGLGQSILAAIEATFVAVRCNTNLGIVLLCVPLLRASLVSHPARDLAARLATVLTVSTLADAVAVFAAIRRANPAGLGRSNEQDVGAVPTLPLVEVMRLAAARDLVAAQYANGFDEVLNSGLLTLRRFRDETTSLAQATTACFLDFLTMNPDSHIARKHGTATAASVQRRARAVASRWKACEDPTARTSILRAFDTELKTEGVNPGTSADLTVASLLALLLDTALKTNSCGTEQLGSTSGLQENEP